jgi:RHS repeat-associated protein
MRFKFLLILLIALVAQSVRAEDRDYVAGPWRYGTSWATAGSNGQSHNHSTEKSALDAAISSINASLWTCSPAVITVVGEWSNQEIVAGFSSYGVRYFNGERGQFSASLYGNGIGTTCNANIGIGGITMVRNRVVSCPAGYSAIGGGTLPCRPNNLPPEKNDCPGKCPNYQNQTLPIHSGMGYQNEIENDYSSASSALSFERYYISATHRAPSLLGNNWRHTYSRALSINQNSVLLDRPDRGRQYFTFVGSVWTPDAGFTERLEHSVGGGWVFTDNSDNKERYSEEGLLLSIEDRNGRVLTMQYDLDQLIAVVDDEGRALTFAYTLQSSLPDGNPNTRLTTVGLPDGQIIRYEYDANGMLERVIYPDATPANSADNPYRRYEYGNGTNASTYQLTGQFDERGIEFLNWQHIPGGPAISSEHGAPSSGIDKVSLVFNVDGSTTITNPYNQSRAYNFTVVNGVKEIASMSAPCPGCGANFAARTYDANGKVDIETDFVGTATDTDYNARGLLTQKIESANKPATKRTMQTDWHATFNVPTERRVLNASNVLEAKTTYAYNTRGQATAMCQVDPNNSTAMAYVCGSATNAPVGVRQSTTTYCEAADVTAGTCPIIGLATSSNGPRTDVSDISTFTYYQNDHSTCATAPTTCPYRKGDLWKVTNALNQVTEYTSYDGAGRALQMKDANNVITDMEYQARGWLTARKVRGTDNASEADDAITRMEYDATGQVTKVIQADGDFVSFNYDAAHRLTSISDALNNSITYTLDNTGNRTAETTKDPSNTVKRSLSRVYDTLGRLQASKNAASATLATLTYDANDNLNTTTDGLNRVTDQDVDPLNRLIKTIQDQGAGKINATTQFEYDARDNLTKVIDPKNLNTVYTYNGLNDLTALASPDTGSTTYTYDEAGNRKTQIDARSKTSTYAYDAANRLISVSVPTAAQNVSFAYDTTQTDCLTGETFTLGRLARITDESGSTRYCYNRLGQPVRKVQSITSGPTMTLGSTYNAANRLVAMTYPSGAIVTYLRNAKGQITNVSAKPTAAAAQVTMVSNATYLPFGPLNTLTFGNTRVLTKAYDQNYDIDKVSDSATDGLSEDSTVNVMGNITAITERTTGTANTTRQFAYDNIDRLLSLKNGATNIQSFTYDATGNRLSKTLATTLSTSAYPSTSHRLSTDGTNARTYDANGNSVTIGVKGFVYDDRNRLRDYKNSGSTVTRTYRYNGKGERVSKVQAAGNANNRYYFYDEAGHLLGEYLANGTRVQEYVWMDDQLVAVLSDHDASLYQFVETDHLGTPRAVVHPVENNIVWRWNITNTAFGEHAATNNPDADAVTFTFNLRYPGQQYDSESTLHYNYFRDYEAGTGRYVQSDPIGFYGDISTYAYVGSSPFKLIDANGLQAKSSDGVINCEMFGWWGKKAGKEAASQVLCPMPDTKCFEKCACKHKVRMARCMLNPICNGNSSRRAEACMQTCIASNKYPNSPDDENPDKRRPEY